MDAKDKGNPEIGKSVIAAGRATNLHDTGEGRPVLLLHGSGPGVTGWANWRTVIPALSKHARVIVPDIAGFGFTERLSGERYSLDLWIKHVIGVLDALDVPTVDIVGNSFGGALALAVASRHPERVRRLVLMGSGGLRFELTAGLDAVWGYTPSFENMRKLLDIFVYDHALATDGLAEMRYRASIGPGFQESYASMFPAPRQRGIESIATDEATIARLPHRALVIHGREDKVIPLESSFRLHHLLSNSELHVFGKCGHWTQIEHAASFNRLVGDFLSSD
jgi:2-hydroxymuconate-semialdehyde hydrolase